MNMHTSTQSSSTSNLAEIAYIARMLVDVGNRLRAQGRIVNDLVKPGRSGSSMFEELDQSQQDMLLNTLRSLTHGICVTETDLSRGVQGALDTIGLF